jgi:hypothetical protein
MRPRSWDRGGRVQPSFRGRTATCVTHPDHLASRHERMRAFCRPLRRALDARARRWLARCTGSHREATGPRRALPRGRPWLNFSARG